jgi:hypothetical protein
LRKQLSSSDSLTNEQYRPEARIPVGSRYGRKAPESCRSRYWQMRQELPSIYLFPFGVEACFL